MPLSINEVHEIPAKFEKAKKEAIDKIINLLKDNKMAYNLSEIYGTLGMDMTSEIGMVVLRVLSSNENIVEENDYYYWKEKKGDEFEN